MRIRILELGSNSFRLCGFSVTESGAVLKLWEVKEFVRLAASLDLEQNLSPSGIERALSAVGRLLSSSWDDAPLVVVATSAVRSAANQEVLLHALRARFGLTVQVLPGQTEARLAYIGARSRELGARDRIAVVDIGGGSTEVVAGDATGFKFCDSVQLGTLRVSDLTPLQLSRHCENLLGSTLRELTGVAPSRVLFACGVARAVGKYMHRSGQCLRPNFVQSQGLSRNLSTISALAPHQLGAYGISEHRHCTLGPGARLIAWIANYLGIMSFDISKQGLREGVALRAWAENGGRHTAPALAAALDHFDSAASDLGANLALDDTSGVHTLSDGERLRLRAGTTS